MAAGKGRKLVIVESPAKAKTIGKYLGSRYIVKAKGRGKGARLEFWHLILNRNARIRPRHIFRDGAASVNQYARRELFSAVAATVRKANA